MLHATLWGKHGKTVVPPPPVLTTLSWYRNPNRRTTEEAVAWILRQLRKGSGAAYQQITMDLERLYNENATPCLCAPPDCPDTVEELARNYLRHPIRGAGSPAGFLASGTSLSFSEYQKSFYAALEAVSQYVIRHPLNDVGVFQPEKSRENSERFEREWLKPLVRVEQQRLLRSANRQLAKLNLVNGSRVRIESVLPDEADGVDPGSETARRSPYDLWFTLLVTHPSGVQERLSAPVNVKFVMPGTAHTNTAGAGMMAWALMGLRDRNNRVHVFDTLQERWERKEPLPDSDYFFLAFSKMLDSPRITEEVWISSLLGSDPNTDAFAYAANQSFPRLQINCRRAEDCLDLLPTANQARLRLINWWSPAERHEAGKRDQKATSVEEVLLQYVMSGI